MGIGGRVAAATKAWVRGLRCAVVGLGMLPVLALAADPQVAAVVDSPDPVAAGGTYTYTVRVDNNAVDAAANTRLTLTVPSGAAFVSASPAGANCTAASATTIACNLGTLGANGADVRNIVFTWRATVAGPSVINATATVSADNDANAANNSQDDTTTVVEGADLALVMTGTPSPVPGGGLVSYTLTASNRGPNIGGAMVVRNTLPPGVSYVSATGSGWTCGQAAGVVTCSFAGPLAVGASAPPITITGRVTVASGTVTNSAQVAPDTGGVADPVSDNDVATVSTPVVAGTDLRMTKTVLSAQPVTAGGPVSFGLQPRNAGPSVAVNVVVTDTLPAGWTFVSATGTGWACSATGQAVRCTRASLAVGATDDITVVATAPATVAAAGSPFTNTAGISSDTPDGDASNDSGAVTLQVRPDGADLLLTKSKTPNPVALGSNMVSTITVSNSGPRSATGPLRVVESLFPGESFISASGTGWVCNLAGPNLVCEHANAGGLAVGASLPVLQVTSRADAAGSMRNEACTGTSLPGLGAPGQALPPAEGDPNAANDCVTATATSTTVRPDLAISKTTSTPTGGDKTVATSEDRVTYTLVVRNASASDGATGVRITDTVPGFIAGRTTFGAFNPVVSAGTATFSCSGGADGTVTCNQTGGTLAPNQTVTVPVVVLRPLRDGSFTNTASVSNTAEGDPDASNNSAQDTVVIAPIADVAMTGKTVTPASVRAGQNATYVLSFANNGPSTATDVVVTDSFSFANGADTGFTVVAITSSRSGSTCSLAAGAQITPAAPALSCSIGTLADGQAESITLVLRPNFMTGNPARTVGNTAAITTSSVENPAGGDNGNNSRTATLAITAAQLDLLVNKTDLVDPVPYYNIGEGPEAGTFLKYQVLVSNTGPSYGTGVKITEVMTPPASPARTVRFVCDTTTYGGSTCNSPSLCTVSNVDSASGQPLAAFTCDVPAGNATTGLARGDLAARQSKPIWLRFQALDQPQATGDVFRNTATASANEPDSNPANNSATEPTTTRQRVDLRVSKTSSLAAVAVNQPFTWTVGVVNNGPGVSLQTDLSDTLPVGAEATGPVTFTRTGPAGSGSCTVTGRSIACALGQLNANASAVVSVPARFTSVPTGGAGTNTATVDTDPAKTGGIDTPGGNNTATNTVAVSAASLAGTVFQDTDRAAANAGTPQAGELRIAGVAIRLTGTDAFGNPIDRSTVTAADGSYAFTGLPPSDATGYTVTETQPAGYGNGPVAPPTSGGAAPSAGGSHAAGGALGNSSYSGVVLATGTAATQYNFPELRQATLAGFVYIDANVNGVRDAGTDTPIAGATVRLLNATTGAVVATTTTDAAGAYAFTGLDPLLAYTLEQPLPTTPANLANGPVNPGLVNGAACATGCTAQPDSPAAGTDRIAAIDLSAGDGTQFNFGERQRTSISGLVYVDADRNNALGAGDTGRIAGVVLRLVQGVDCASGTTLQTTTSAADGSWRFDNVVAGAAYLVCETQPAGYGNGNANGTAASNVISIAALPAGGLANQLFGELLASIAGTVYQDNGTGIAAQADNGVKDAGEVGIANVPVTVTGTDVAGNPVSRSTSTDASGNWRIDGLLAADASGYTVAEGVIPPASGSFIDGRETAGSAGGNASAVNDRISAVALAAGQQATGYLFGELGIAPISGTVYIDLNRNGALDAQPTDGRIAGVVLNLVRGTDCSAAPVASTTTDAAGNYSFSGAAAGLAYSLCEVQPAGYLQGGENAGSGNTAVANVISIPSLAVTGSAGNHFGEIASNSVIAGRVWLDADNSGSIETSESGIAGVTLTLSGTDSAGNAVSRSTTTAADGSWRFEALPPGTYTVTEPTQPSGTLNGRTVPGRIAGAAIGNATTPGATPSVISAIVLGLSQMSLDNNFGELPPALLAGRVYADNNDNGAIDTGETGLAGVVITLTGTDDTGAPVTRSATTGADGSYAFTDLRPGSYTLTEPTQPGSTVNGRTTPGTLGGTATTPATATSAITAITVAPGGQGSGYNFGEIGNSPDLRVATAHTPATVTVNNRFPATLVVRNAGELPTSGPYTVSDRLPAGLTLAGPPTSAAGTGWTCTGAAGDTSFSCTSSAVLAAGASSPAINLSLRVAADALARSPLQNLALVEGGGELPARLPGDAERAAFNAGNADALPLCDAAVLHNVCRDPAVVQASASVAGTAWFDVGATLRQLDAGDRRLPGWTVEVVDASGVVVGSAVTAADGTWQVADLVPGLPLQVRYRHPQTGVVFGYPVNGDTGPGSSGATCDANAAANGTASSCAHTSGQPVLDIVLAPGRLLPQQSLPLGVDPSGVLYDAGSRTPLGGGTVTLAPTAGTSCPGWDPTTQIAGATLGGYTVNGSAISVPVGSDGLYQFLFLANAPGRCSFTLTVTPPAGYTAPSVLIPGEATALVQPQGSGTYAVQPQAGPPLAGSATTWYGVIQTGSLGPAVVNNHIPLDPVLPGGISLQKTGDRAVAEVGDTVRYTVTVQLTSGNVGARPRQTTVVDRLPAGFTYVPGTAFVDGVRIADPTGSPGPALAFNLGAMPATNRLVLQYRLRVGVGSQQGDGINRAQAHACGVVTGCVGADGRTPIASSVATNEARHQVRVSGGVFAAEACVLGKVFVDCNGNHIQDREELGVPGVRLLLSDGTNLVSDSEGKYSLCGLPPRSHVLRIDPHTLPRGSRLTTSSNRNLGDAGSLWLDLKNGELHRADFIEGSCSNTVLDQVKARRAQGEVRAPETERAGQPALRFDSKGHGLDAQTSPQQGTDSANQRAPKPRATDGAPARGGADRNEQNLPTPSLPMNRPPPAGRTTGQADDSTDGGRDAQR